MHLSPLFAAGIADDLAKAASETAHTFGFNTHHFIAQVISFGIVAFLLHRFAYKPILQVLEERRTRIAESLENADRIKAELAHAQAQANEVITQASLQANKIIEESRTAAAKVGEIERQKAIADASSIIAKAREAGDAELARLKGELRKEFGRLVVAASRNATGNILTLDQHNKLAEDASKQLAA